MHVPLLAFFACFFLGSTALSAASEPLPAISAHKTPHRLVSAHDRQPKVCFVFGINALWTPSNDPLMRHYAFVKHFCTQYWQAAYPEENLEDHQAYLRWYANPRRLISNIYSSILKKNSRGYCSIIILSGALEGKAEAVRDDLGRRSFNLATDQIHCIGKENLSARESSALKGKYLANLIRTSDYAKVFYIDTDLRALRAASQAWQEASADGKEVILIHSTEPQGEFALKLYPSENYRNYVALILFAEHIIAASKAASSSSSGAYKIPSFHDLVSGLSSNEDTIISGAVYLDPLEPTVKDRLYRFFEQNWPLVLEQEGISYQPSHTAPMPAAHAGPA